MIFVNFAIKNKKKGASASQRTHPQTKNYEENNITSCAKELCETKHHTQI